MNIAVFVGIFLGVVLLLIFVLKGVRRFLKWWEKTARNNWENQQELKVLRLLVPKEDDTKQTKGPLLMEQIFTTLSGLSRHVTWGDWFFYGLSQERISFEIAYHNSQVSFYVVIPQRFQKVIEGQIYGQYPDVEIQEVDDYIDFQKKETSHGAHFPTAKSSVFKNHYVLAQLKLSNTLLFPLKTYDFFTDKEDKTQVETLSALVSSLSKLNSDEDTAWFQMVISPEKRSWQNYGAEMLFTLKQGYFTHWSWAFGWVSDWYILSGFWQHWLWKWPITSLLKILWFVLGQRSPVEETSSLEKQEIGYSLWELPKKKLIRAGFQSSLKLGYVTRKGDIPGAQLKLKEMAAAFMQFSRPGVNSLELSVLTDSLSHSAHEVFLQHKNRSVSCSQLLASDELATLWHLPMKQLEVPNVAWVRSKRLEAPSDLPVLEANTEITPLGRTNFRASKKAFGIKRLDRRRHMYIIGKTGMGKSTVLENMVFDDIQKGRGVAAVDPHGELAEKMVTMIPEHRVKDVIIFDPSDVEFPVSFNMLEVKNPDHRPLVASGLVGVFKKMYADSWGPRLEYILRNCILALTEYESATLLGIPRMLIDPLYREKVVSAVQDPVVKAFWVDEFANMSPKLRTEAISPIQNKVGQFLSSPVIRNILGQSKSSIDIRAAMDQEKILIVNLSKGKIGEDNSSLLGSMLITKFQLDAMSRADIDLNERKDFYLYVDEFQNFATDSFATILSEARKYRLNLVMANQYVQQMAEEVMHAVFGNVGTMMCFQVGYDDAEYFSKQFGELVSPNDIISLPKYTTYVRLLVDNMPSKVFSSIMNPPVDTPHDLDRVQKVVSISRQTYGKQKTVVEDSIKRWSAQVGSSEIKKAIKAQQQPGVRWRYDRNKSEFEDLLNSAGKVIREIDREEFEDYAIKDASNEYVYELPHENLIIYSRIDVQGNCFNKKGNTIDIYEYQENNKKVHTLKHNVAKEAGWQITMNEAIGGGFRSPQNRAEMELAFVQSGFDFELIKREKFSDFGLPRSLNELVYTLVRQNDKQVFTVVSALDPQGNCFTRNPLQVIRICQFQKDKLVQLQQVDKHQNWIENLKKALLKL